MSTDAPTIDVGVREGHRPTSPQPRKRIGAGLRGEEACVAIPIAVNRPAAVGFANDEPDRCVHYHGGRLPFWLPGCQVTSRILEMRTDRSECRQIPYRTLAPTADTACTTRTFVL